MRFSRLALLAGLTIPVILAPRRARAEESTSLLIRNGLLIDGTGSPRRQADVRIFGGVVQEIGHLAPKPGEKVIDAKNLVVAPGFIDTHSHVDGGLLDHPTADTAIRQGITTAIIGQDGFHHLPLKDYLKSVEDKHVALNIASFIGHNTIRSAVMGEDFKRKALPEEVERMTALAEQEMRSGALGLSSGLEYDPGLYSDTEEVVALAKVASAHGGMYISHVRDEEDEALTSFRELIRISREAKLPAQISHIKLGSSPVWGKAGEVFKMMADASRQGPKISADVYPYTYWRSTITVITPTRDWADRAAWQKGLDEIGGPGHVLLSTYSPDPTWENRTIADISKTTGKDPVTVIQEIVAKTHGEGVTGREGVIVTAMREDDVRKFVAHPGIMFCTDGGLGGGHPRAAGSFPRVLARFVRQDHALTLEAAIHKMTQLPAETMGLKGRGVLRPGAAADVVLFNPKTVQDTATTKDPLAQPIGLPTVIVNGTPVLQNGQITGATPGQVLRKIP